MKRRFLSVALTLGLTFLAGSAKAEGTYQRTTDNKTMVWNAYPTEGETISWSGKQDNEEYATGYGELTFYKKAGFTFAKHDVVSERYSGKMVRGKFEGPVETVSKNGEKSHATFAGGKRTDDWEPGPAPNANETNIASKSASPSQTRVPSQTNLTEPEAAAPPPAEGPAKTEDAPTANIQRPEPEIPSTKKAPIEEAETAPPTHESLRSLAAPPASLQSNTATDASPSRSRLTTPEVIVLADTTARSNGYDLNKYQNPQSQYNSAADMWAVSYEKKSNADESTKRFSVRIDDKTDKATIVTDQ